jgi:hypothetical protein
MKEQRDGLLQQTMDLEDAKTKWWSEEPKRERLTEDLHKRRKREAQEHHDRLRDEFRLDCDKQLEDAIRQIREAALEYRDRMQKYFSDKAQQMQKDFDDKAGQMQKDLEDKAQLAQDAANLHTTKQVEKVLKEIEMVALRTQQTANTEHSRRMKEAAESHRLRVEKEAKSKLEALDAEDAAQTYAFEAQRVARKEQRVAREAALDAEDAVQTAAFEAQRVARGAALEKQRVAREAALEAQNAVETAALETQNAVETADFEEQNAAQTSAFEAQRVAHEEQRKALQGGLAE